MKRMIKRPDILNSLLKDCKKSDRCVAKEADVSQPTVTRTRQYLEKTGIIKNYFAIPDLTKLGYKFGAIVIADISPEALKEISEENVFISAPVMADDYNVMFIILFKTVKEYGIFLSNIKTVTDSLDVTLFATEGFRLKPVQVPEKEELIQ